MSDERFARQYPYKPPPEFLLASPSTRIDHHLSGPIMNAPTRIHPKKYRWVVRPEAKDSHLSLSLCARVLKRPCTCIHVRLLGPCYKTGRVLPFRQRLQGTGGSPITEVQRTHALHVDERAPGPRVTRITPPEGVPFRPRTDGT